MPSKENTFRASWLDFAGQKVRKCPFFRESHMRAPDQTTRFANPPSLLCSRKAESSFDSPARVKLLISIRNTEEATIVRDAGVDWIDLKDPSAGSLGRSSLSDAVAVAEMLSDYPQRSAALGELHDLDEQVALEFAPLFPVLKVGLSGLMGSQSDRSASWQARFQSLATQLRDRGAELIPVAYADWSICGAPALQEVLTLAQAVRARHLLIDTFVKDGRGLLDWLSVDELVQVVQSAAEFDCGIVLAGSLKFADVPALLKLQPAALAVRGAVCQADSSAPESLPLVQSRTAPIDVSKVELWRNCICNAE
jgi:(5-formylfuran-3-yl)methyl phosphate synthase